MNFTKASTTKMTMTISLLASLKVNGHVIHYKTFSQTKVTTAVRHPATGLPIMISSKSEFWWARFPIITDKSPSTALED